MDRLDEPGDGQVSEKDTLYILGGAALVLLGAGLLLSNRTVRRTLEPGGGPGFSGHRRSRCRAVFEAAIDVAGVGHSDGHRSDREVRFAIDPKVSRASLHPCLRRRAALGARPQSDDRRPSGDRRARRRLRFALGVIGAVPGRRQLALRAGRRQRERPARDRAGDAGRRARDRSLCGDRVREHADCGDRRREKAATRSRRTDSSRCTA